MEKEHTTKMFVVSTKIFVDGENGQEVATKQRRSGLFPHFSSRGVDLNSRVENLFLFRLNADPLLSGVQLVPATVLHQLQRDSMLQR